MQDAKNRQKFGIWAPSQTLSGYILAPKARIDNRKNLLNSNISPTYPYNMANFGLLAIAFESTLLVRSLQAGQPVMTFRDL